MEVRRVLFLLLLVGCTGTEPGEILENRDGGTPIERDGGELVERDGGVPEPDLTEPVFAAGHLIDVDIDLDPADWDVLRNQARTIADLLGDTVCIDSPPTSPYIYFPARVTIDGETFDDVGVRKKGFFGSVNPVKPSLKLKFDEFVMGREWSGFERMTFNNGRQGGERSLIRQCLAYHLFANAGIVAPRCNYGHISVNGEDLGVFVHVEAIKKRMLRRWFDDAEGALYEGAISDFRPSYIDTFERKTNRMVMDRSDLQAMADALEVPDAELLDRLEPILDIDGFIQFWALEVLIGHWDGYSGRNNNNFYIYRDPTTGKFSFIPWGVDAIMGRGPANALEPVYAYSVLTRRLYLNPATQAQFLTRMEELLTTVWDETTLLTEIRDIEMLIRPYILREELALFQESITQLRGFVQGRRDEIRGQLAGGPPPWTTPLGGPFCLQTAGEISGTFTSTWGTFPADNPLMVGDGTMTATVNETNFVGINGAADVGGDGQGNAIIRSIVTLPQNALAAIVIVMPLDMVRAGSTFPIEVGGPVSAVLYYVPAPGAQVEQVGQIFQGTVTLDQAGTAPDAPIFGRYEGVLFSGFGPG